MVARGKERAREKTTFPQPEPRSKMGPWVSVGMAEMMAFCALRELGMGEIPTRKLVRTMEISAPTASPTTIESKAFIKRL
jgi:hypothetical protein